MLTLPGRSCAEKGREKVLNRRGFLGLLAALPMVRSTEMAAKPSVVSHSIPVTFGPVSSVSVWTFPACPTGTVFTCTNGLGETFVVTGRAQN